MKSRHQIIAQLDAACDLLEYRERPGLACLGRELILEIIQGDEFAYATRRSLACEIIKKAKEKGL